MNIGVARQRNRGVLTAVFHVSPVFREEGIGLSIGRADRNFQTERFQRVAGHHNKRGKTPGTQVQQSLERRNRMADFCPRCVRSGRIDP